MLESSQLLLRPWAPSTQLTDRLGRTPSLTWTRGILDAASDEVLGAASWRQRATPIWLRWLVRPSVEVYETEDQSLLCTVRRGWGPATSWHVSDADGRPVGTIRGAVVLNALGRRLGVFESLGAGTTRRFRAPDGREMGTLQQRGDGTLVSFGADLEGDPFSRMILLAAALAERQPHTAH
jgi:hypothetical protein